MMIGTDIQAFKKLLFSEDMPTHWFPIYYEVKSVYTPMDKLPQDIRILYDYNPTLAKKMLADAGYPNGINTFLEIDNSFPEEEEVGSLLKDQWSKIGVNIEIQPVEGTVAAKMEAEVSYKGTAVENPDIANPFNMVVALGKSTGFNNWAGFSDPYYDELCSKLELEPDIDRQNTMIREAGLYLLQHVPYLPLSPVVRGHAWWPWLKNYYGEKTSEDGTMSDVLSYVWIDQDMKKKMGY